MFGCAATAASNARSISRPVMSFACRMRRLEWPPSVPRSSSRAPCDRGISRSVKFHAQLDQLRDARRAFLDDGADDVFLAQARARLQRVAHVQLERILLAGHRRDAALGVVGVRLRAVLLGDDGHAPVRRDLQGERKPRDAAAENEEIELFHLESCVVNQPRFADEHRQRHVRAARDFGNRRQGFRVEEFHVIQPRGRRAFDEPLQFRL